jgi:hypothetical protein
MPPVEQRRRSGARHDTTLRRWIGKLPRHLRDCIRGMRGAGRYLQLS